MAVLILKNGKHAGHLLNIPPGKVTVGRESDSSIRIPSEEVSRHHCTLIATEDGIQVEDHGSKNGTFVNGEAIFGVTMLKGHDTLKIGPMVFEVAVPAKPEVKPASAGESTIHHESDTAVNGKSSPADPAIKKKKRKASDPKTDPAKKQKFKAKKATEESIIDWLDDDHESEEPQVHETTIITQEDIASDPEMAALDSIRDAEPIIAPAKKRKKKKVDPTIEQASDIIRRYWNRKRNS